MNALPEGQGTVPVVTDTTTPEPRPTCDLTIVGIGASAGGLEALETLFQRMPLDTGMAFVVLQHLSPDHESHMASLLARQTQLPIRVAQDGMRVEPNQIYLNPPKKDLILSEQRIRLTDQERKRGLTLPIDHFFHSLAHDVGRCAVGVVLSGTGSDGSRGVRAIHEAGGLVIAQSEETSKFNGMPRNAQRTGCVDLILPPEEIPDALLHYASKQGRQALRGGVAHEFPPDSAELSRVYKLLRMDCGIDFSLYKPSTVMRRLERRRLLQNGESLESYIDRLTTDRGELSALHHDLLIGVTHFFRDKDAFNRLALKVISPILARPGDDEVRVWVAGCATGEEAYSLAMLFREQMELTGRHRSVRIFATDVHRASLDFASAGLYREESLAELSGERRSRFFTKVRDRYQVSSDLRKMVVFAPHNIISDAPFTRLDLVTCRNLLIYLQPIAQKKALSLFHFGLKTGGALFLGPSETPGDLQAEFEPLDKHWRIYRKRRDVHLPPDLRLTFDNRASTPRQALRPQLDAQPVNESQLVALYDRLLGRYLPPSILVDENGNILHVFGGAEAYLRTRGGRPTSNLLELIAKELRAPLNSAMRHAANDGKTVRYSGLRLRETSDNETLRLVVEPISDPATGALHMLVSFEKLEAPAQRAAEVIDLPLEQIPSGQISILEAELRRTRENLQATIEALETSNEELQAANEELVASNEELQSTNEELHSVNEELYAVNAEHQRKITELTELTDDMDNLLQSTDVGVIFLDAELCVRKFTPRMASAFHLLPQDIGRPLDSFANILDDNQLLNDLREVLRSEQPVEREVRDREGRSYFLRILPYRTKTGAEGVVLTLIDIDVLKRQEEDVRRLSEIVESTDVAIIGANLAGKIEHWNGGAARLFRYTSDEVVGRHVSVLFPADDRAEIDALLESVRGGLTAQSIELPSVRGGDAASLFARWTVSAVRNRSGEVVGLSLVGYDLTDRKQTEDSLAESEMRMRKIVESAMDAVIGMDDAGLVIRWNPKAEKMFRYTAQEAIGQPLSELIIPPNAREAHLAGLKQFLETGRGPILNKRLELTAMRRGGQRFPVELTVAANRFGERYEFSAFVRDITQRRRAERRLATEHAISQLLIGAQDLDGAAPQILSSFCRTLEVDVCELWLPGDDDNRLSCAFYHSNLASDEALAYREAALQQQIAPGEDLIGKVFQRREPMWSTDLERDCIFNRSQPAMAAGLASVYAFPLLLHREVLGVLCFATSEELPPNVALLEMMIAVGHDLGQFVRRSRFEHELGDARKAAEAASEAKSAFLANMSHEIRTPMTSVVGLTELLLASESDPSRIEMLRMIQRSSHHLVELINDILDLSKIESGKLAVERVHCSPVNLIQDLASVMGVRAKEKGLYFEVSFDGRIPATIYTDPMRLRQILINLVGNAVKFTNQGGVRIVTRYLGGLEPPRIEFEVTDTGIGMSEQELSRLFEPFSQVDHSVTRRFGGTGLGLCISQRLAGALQGEILVTSKPNVGSSFRLQIATDLADAEKLIDPTEQPSPTSPPPADRGEVTLSGHVLVAEDTRGIQYLIKRFLEGAGAQVSLAGNGQEAIERLREAESSGRPVDVVIMDMHMPVLSGYDAVAQLRADGSQVPIIALTARAMQGDREKCLSVGCNEYLPKPVDRLNLLEAVATQLKSRESERTEPSSA